MGRAKRIWYLSPMRAAKVQASLRIRAVSPEPPLLAHTSSESSGTFRQKARSLAHLNSWACAVEICHDGMLEDTNSLGAAHMTTERVYQDKRYYQVPMSYKPHGIRHGISVCQCRIQHVHILFYKMKPEDHWSCIAHLSAEDMLKSAVF